MRNDERRCFMHIPKCGGVSVRATLEAALPSGSLAEKRSEPSSFSSFDDFDRLHPEARAQVAATDAEIRALADHRAICGHFSLQTLEALAPRANIATVLREPRARVISQYLFMRLKPALRTYWAAYRFHTPAEGRFAEFLSEPRVAMATDNRICRQVLYGDPRIRDGRFIETGDLEGVAEAAWDRLKDLGFVGILELPDEAWRGVGELFGVELRPQHRHVTGKEDVSAGPDEIQQGMLPVPPFGGTETLELLERRSAGDAILYERIASRFRGSAEGASGLADAAFAGQLVRYGAFTADAAAEVEGERRAHAATRERLESCTEALAGARETVDTITHSRSWRLTEPLRRVGRIARRRYRGSY
jgi:Sulfotransferase domain